jgi:acyl dehydratase
MALQYHALKSLELEVEQTYDTRHVMLYALGVGVGSDPLDEGQLRFVYDRGLVALPTLADVLAYPPMWIDEPRFGLDWGRLVHGGQSLVVRAPLPVAATVVGRTRVAAVVDKGRGALIVLERTLHDRADGRLLAENRMTLMARGDGGFSELPDNGPPGGDAFSTEPVVLPQRAPDRVVERATLPQAALLYRLVADPNPLHADPQAARAAGFDRPVLHGMCAYGMAAHAILRAFCDDDPSRLESIALRFSAPVFPGDTLAFSFWRDGSEIRFRAVVADRAATVLDQGAAKLRA